MATVDENLRLLLGSLLTGCYVEIFLQGILYAQCNHYFHYYRDDHCIIKVVVAGLLILTTLKSCQSFAMLWIEFIDTFAEPDPAFINFTDNWTLQGNPLMVAVTGLYIRAYFCYRLYVISKAWWTAALIATTDLVALGFIATGVHLLPNLTDHNEVLLFYTLHFIFVFVGDILLSLLTAFFLIRSKKGALPQTRGFIDALISMSFQTALPGAICSLVSLVTSQLTVNGFQVLSAFNEIIPQLYAVTMMWTLNARHELRDLSRGNNVGGISHLASGTHQWLASKRDIERVPPGDLGDVEAGQFNVNVQKEMFTHVDASDVFTNIDQDME